MLGQLQLNAVGGDDKITDPTVAVSIKINLAAALEAAHSPQHPRDLLESAQLDCRALRKDSAALYFDEMAISIS